MAFSFPLVRSDAVISNDGKHRYSLSRWWDHDVSKPAILFIGLNPSRADESFNDPTITRCIKFAQHWPVGTSSFHDYVPGGLFGNPPHFGRMYFANLYSFRTPLPKVLISNMDRAIGPKCDRWLEEMIRLSEMVVCCWGSWKFIRRRASQVLSMIKHPVCLGINKDGHPKHPLYLKNTTIPQPYPIPEHLKKLCL